MDIIGITATIIGSFVSFVLSSILAWISRCLNERKTNENNLLIARSNCCTSIKYLNIIVPPNGTLYDQNITNEAFFTWYSIQIQNLGLLKKLITLNTPEKIHQLDELEEILAIIFSSVDKFGNFCHLRDKSMRERMKTVHNIQQDLIDGITNIKSPRLKYIL